jgi:phytoene/squalene synthetase
MPMPDDPPPALSESHNKRGGFVSAMRIVSTFLPEPNAQVLLHCYAGLRPLDNVVDGDAPVPEGYASAADYVRGRKEHLARGTIEDGVDMHLRCAQAAAHRAGFPIRDELETMLAYFLFDAERTGTWRTFRRAELDAVFFSRDIFVCTRIPLMAFGEDAGRWDAIAPLAEAARTGYDSLRDLAQDLGKGVVNIPSEDMAAFGIAPARLALPDPLSDPAVRAWRKHEARRGISMLGEYRRAARGLDLKPFTRATLAGIYEAPAYARFARSLAGF